jgi:toxin ParE1/3/4
MKRFVLSIPAERDLNELIIYLAEREGRDLARRILRDLRKAIRFLSDYPEIGHRRRDITDEPVRFWLVHSYLIVYDPTPRPIEILRIIHGSRDLRGLV